MIKDFIKAFMDNMIVILKLGTISIVLTIGFFILCLLLAWGCHRNILATNVIIIVGMAFLTTLIMDYRDIYKRHKGGK